MIRPGKERFQRNDDFLGIGRIQHIAALLVESGQGAVVLGFRDVQLLHNGFPQRLVVHNRDVGLDAVVLVDYHNHISPFLLVS